MAETPARRAPTVADLDSRWRIWQRRQRRRVLGHALLLLLCMAMIAAAGWTAMLTWSIFERHVGGATLTLPRSWPMLLIFPIFLVWWMIESIRSLRRSIRVLKRVPANDGACCWRCLGAMRPMTASPTRLSCARCDIHAGVEQARTYWEQTHLSPGWSRNWKARRAGGRRSRWRRLMLTFAHRTKHRPRVRQAATVAMGLVPTIILAGIMWLFIGRGVAIMLLVMSLMLGAIGLILGPSRPSPLTAGSGIERRCARCGYDVALLGDLPERCPECGEGFDMVGSIRIVTRMERTTPRSRSLAIGIFFCVVASSVGFLAMSGSAWIMRPLPTGMLSSLVGESVLGDGAITELLRRTLTAEQQRTIIERALELRADDDMSAYRARKALDPFVLAGTMAADLLDRYLLEAASFTIAGPASWDGRTGLRLLLEVEDRSGSGIAPGIGVLFAGWTIDGALAPGPAGVPASVVHALLLVDRSRPSAASYQLAPPLDLAPRPDRDRLVVQARVWLVLTPGVLGGTIVQWNPDGTPNLPPGVILAREVTVEREVRLGQSSGSDPLARPEAPRRSSGND